MKAIIITRDRVSYARMCFTALADSEGIGDIHIVDHGSTYPPMLDWLGGIAGAYWRPDWKSSRDPVEPKGRVHVHWKPNAHPRDLWVNGTLASIVTSGERFIVTDHDVVVPSEAPWVDQLAQLLWENLDIVKAGLQLRTRDLDPAVHRDAQRIIEWESQYRPPRAMWSLPSAERAGWVRASVDTTVAMYRDLRVFTLDPAVRTVEQQFEAVHLPWYESADDAVKAPEAKAEQDWYREHAEHGHWRDPEGFADSHGLPADVGG
jgi:hypothetical protein